MKKALVASVAVEGTVFHFDKPYDYLLPDEIAQNAKAGCRVTVPFGKGNRKRQAVILDIKQVSDVSRVKPVLSLIDTTPVLSEEMLSLASWMREHLFCTYFDAFKVMLPSGINMRIVVSYCISDSVTEESIEFFDGEERRLLETLYNSKATVEKDKLFDAAGVDADSKAIDSLCEKGLVIRSDDAVRKIGDATIKMVKLNVEPDRLPKLTDKQKAVCELVEQAGSASVKEVCYFVGCTVAVVTNLIKKGILFSYDNVVYRSPYDLNMATDRSEIDLTEKQDEAYQKLREMYMRDKGGAALLYGVTGSGKTSVFMKLVDNAFNDNKGTIVMVPEISLTPQTLNLFYKRYGGKVAVFHSAMSLGQRMDEWRRIKNGEALVAIGTRSAVFAPFENLALIIMDEEQEHTYKSESSPRFHARDIARYRCAYNNALLLLSSATPSIETYCAAKQGRYELCELPERYGNAVLPTVHTVDMNQEIKSGNKSAFSNFLIDRLSENLANKKQSILLLNRRGHNTFVSCSQCGHVMTCPNCSISLTYHSANGRLMCHYCGHSEEFSQKCPQCGNDHIRYSGEGTQKAEQELSLFFPNARVLRMDADSTMTRNSYEQKLSAFAKGEYDIMLGTQMVAKGLNFPNVTLVGVLNADSSLYSEDFRAYERTFSLLTQVIGRSGRGDCEGIAVIQTVTPENEIISLATQQDYNSFYESEIMTRRIMTYPPYCSMCVVGFSGVSEQDVKVAAQEFLTLLKGLNSLDNEVKMIVLGPTPAAVLKVGGKYRYRLLIKTRNNVQFRKLIKKTLCDFFKSQESKTVSVFADINPENLF